MPQNKLTQLAGGLSLFVIQQILMFQNELPIFLFRNFCVALKSLKLSCGACMSDDNQPQNHEAFVADI